MKTIKKARPAGSLVKEHRVDEVVAELRRLSSEKYRQGMTRFAIPSDNAFGVPVGEIRALGKRLGRSSQLAAELWAAGWYEARMLAVFVEDPASVTPKQMDQWCRDFDSWAICDTACFHLFDRTPLAERKEAAPRWIGKDALRELNSKSVTTRLAKRKVAK